jgi:hypothetical protein
MEMSQEIKDIAESLALAQSEIEGASKDRINPHFKSSYATLASVWEACRAALTKNGLSVVQGAKADGNLVTVTSMLLHKSGQWFKDQISMRAMNETPQAIGSAITYGRRYALAALVGVAPEDDDGNAGSGRPEPLAQSNGNMRYAPDKSDAKTKKMRAELNKALQGCKSMKEFQAACKAFQTEHGKIVWDAATTHNDMETFGLLAGEHKARLESEEHFISPEGRKEWRAKLAACSEKEFPHFQETIIAYPEYRDCQECNDAIAQRGRELGIEEYALGD